MLAEVLDCLLGRQIAGVLEPHQHRLEHLRDVPVVALPRKEPAGCDPLVKRDPARQVERHRDLLAAPLARGGIEIVAGHVAAAPAAGADRDRVAILAVDHVRRMAGLELVPGKGELGAAHVVPGLDRELLTALLADVAVDLAARTPTPVRRTEMIARTGSNIPCPLWGTVVATAGDGAQWIPWRGMRRDRIPDRAARW